MPLYFAKFAGPCSSVALAKSVRKGHLSCFLLVAWGNKIRKRSTKSTLPLYPKLLTWWDNKNPDFILRENNLPRLAWPHSQIVESLLSGREYRTKRKVWCFHRNLWKAASGSVHTNSLSKRWWITFPSFHQAGVVLLNVFSLPPTIFSLFSFCFANSTVAMW